MKLERFTTTLLVTALLVGGLIIANLTAYSEPSAARPVAQRQSYIPATWEKTVVDAGTDITGQYDSLVLDVAQRPHISYYKRGGGFGNLMYAHWELGHWVTTTTAIDASQGIALGWFTSLTLDSAGRPQISYHGYATGSSTVKALKYAHWNGNKWTIDPPIDANNGAGQYTSIKVDANDRPRISYYAALSADLRYAYFDGSQWKTEVVDSIGDVGWYSSLALESGAGVPHIAYKDGTETKVNTVKHAYRIGANTWVTQTLVNLDTSDGGHISIKLDTNNLPHIAYYNNSSEGAGSLRYIYATAFNDQTHQYTWSTPEIVDAAGDPGRYCSLALAGGTSPRISYYENKSRKLMYAVRLGPNNWQTDTVDAPADADVGSYSSLALDNLGNPHISYYDATNHALKYAKPIAAPNPFTETPTSGPTSTYTPTPTGTPTQTNTPTMTLTPSATPTATRTLTPSNTPRAKLYLPVLVKSILG
jgi:hypothetical protein